MEIDTAVALFEQDKELMTILAIIRSLGLKDAWLAAGTLRNYLWNYLSAKPVFEAMTDLDVIFFDKQLSYEETLALEANLIERYPSYKWELKNQVAMHRHSPHTLPYESSRDAVAKYPERCTAIAARLDDSGRLELFAPYGLEDISDFVVRPTPHFLSDPSRMAVYQERLAKKKWQSRWQQLILKNE